MSAHFETEGTQSFIPTRRPAKCDLSAKRKYPCLLVIGSFRILKNMFALLLPCSRRDIYFLEIRLRKVTRLQSNKIETVRRYRCHSASYSFIIATIRLHGNWAADTNDVSFTVWLPTLLHVSRLFAGSVRDSCWALAFGTRVVATVPIGTRCDTKWNR